jgi:hypothetical protein
MCLFGGCLKPRPESGYPTVLVVNEDDIREAEEEGYWLVSDGWMIRRLDFEQSLLRRLEECETPEESDE